MYRNFEKRYSDNVINNEQINMNNDMLENSCSNVSSYEDDINECECGFSISNNVFPDNPMYGQSYVPIQYMDKTFKPAIGLKMGTIFPELVSPYVPCMDMKEQEFIAMTNKIGEGCAK